MQLVLTNVPLVRLGIITRSNVPFVPMDGLSQRLSSHLLDSVCNAQQDKSQTLRAHTVYVQLVKNSEYFWSAKTVRQAKLEICRFVMIVHQAPIHLYLAKMFVLLVWPVNIKIRVVNHLVWIVPLDGGTIRVQHVVAV